MVTSSWCPTDPGWFHGHPHEERRRTCTNFSISSNYFFYFCVAGAKSWKFSIPKYRVVSPPGQFYTRRCLPCVFNRISHTRTRAHPQPQTVPLEEYTKQQPASTSRIMINETTFYTQTHVRSRNEIYPFTIKSTIWWGCIFYQ